MKKYKKLVIICLLLIICSFTIMIAVFSQLSPKISPEKQALTFYKEYLSACQKSYADAFSYVYFLNDWEKEAWMGSSQDYLVEYEILDGPHQLNESLFVIECRFQTAAGQAMGKDSKTLYGYFCNALDRALNDTAQTIDASAQREDLARMALDLALRSYANQLACARILDILQPPGTGKK